MRKYLFNGAIIGAVAGGWSLAQTTRTGRRDWTLVLMWVSWALGLAIAIATTKQKSDELQAQDAESRKRDADHGHRKSGEDTSQRRRTRK